ncbi:unnamed protein product [Paramecium sonneborni]|uniref:Uncharacterized protein n=1 Tax=Paramecium sonneborni TaxID=65129 RepID=A0A8S1MGA9_9CILI|nr:unnamed protein product [Paramecium sonneborni]
MQECQEQDHNQQEIILICINMDCQLKRACCLDCIQKHKSHKQDLKTIKQITLWKKNTTQSYELYQKKMNQIIEIMGQAEKYLSDIGEDIEKSLEVIMNEEYEKQISNLLRIQQLSSSFNQLISNLETLMEPISQIFSIVDASSRDKQVKTQTTQNNPSMKLKTIVQEQQIKYKQKIDLENQEFKQNQGIKILNNLNIIRKENNFNIYQYPRYYKSSIEYLEDYKTIILIGTQSSEKQNLINLFVNYYNSVQFTDPYRFEIIDDIDINKEKQNDEYEQMKVYYIIPQNGQSGLRIIYTPDYNDDLCYDDQNKSDIIYNLISNSISLNQNILIGFVIPQQVQIGSFYMLESILSKFPNILIQNIVFLFPDCINDYPKQKQILQSQIENINGILSPVCKMITTMRNIWYLKFNSAALFVNHKTQENQFIWEMGNNSFQLLLNNYLLNKINYNKLSEMKVKYDEFYNTINFYIYIQKMKQKFMELYKRDNFHLDFEQKIEICQQQIGKYINLQNEDYSFYKISQPTKQIIEEIMKKFDNSIEEDNKKLESFQSLFKNQELYNKNFEEFQDLFKNFENSMFQEYNSWRLYFRFNSILTSINHSQWKYYEHLNSKEQSSKQEGWEERVKLLNNKTKFFFYFDNQSKIPNLDQLSKLWFDQYFIPKQCSIMQYIKHSWSFKQNTYFETGLNVGNIEITKRILQDCDTHFENFIQKILQVLLS